ncbi:unnamed protein product [Urochloa humidicola]
MASRARESVAAVTPPFAGTKSPGMPTHGCTPAGNKNQLRSLEISMSRNTFFRLLIADHAASQPASVVQQLCYCRSPLFTDDAASGSSTHKLRAWSSVTANNCGPGGGASVVADLTFRAWRAASHVANRDEPKYKITWQYRIARDLTFSI